MDMTIDVFSHGIIKVSAMNFFQYIANKDAPRNK